MPSVCRDSRISIHDEWTIRYANLRYFSEKDYFLIEISLIILQGLPVDNAFSEFIFSQLHLEDDVFGLAKHFYENNFIGNIIGLLF